MEALLCVSEGPVTLDKIQTVLEDYDRKELHEALNQLIEEYRTRDGALEIVEVASGFQVRTRPEFSKWIRKLKQQKPSRLTRSSLETLAIIAYNQPVTRAEIENIRGVDSMGVLGSLVEKQLIRIIGRKEVPGRPLLYGTTPEFLEVFGLKNLKSLPTLKEIEEMLKVQGSEDELPTEEGGGSLTEDTPHVETICTGEDREDVAEQAVVISDSAGALAEEEEQWTGQEITTEEMDDILKSARAKCRSVKKELGIKDSGEEGPDGRSSEETGKTGE